MKKQLLFAFLLLTPGIRTLGQAHLKSVQVTSVWAPTNVKIDGKLNEWEDNFQAYNKSTKLFYTLSNNGKYLYLAVTTTDAETNTKFAAGGITLIINTGGRKKDKGAFILTYPVIASASRRGGGRFGRQQSGASTGTTDTAAINSAHRQLIATSKEIKVFGFKDVDDTLISIYNEYGIKTAIGYDTLGNYGYEVAIPLKMLGLSVDNAPEIAYNIKINGLQINFNSSLQGKMATDAFQSGGFGGGRGGRSGGGRTGGGDGGKSATDTDYLDLTSPTDFWGKYTLAKNKVNQ